MTHLDDTESSLIERVAQGCEEATRELIKNYSGRLLGFLNKRGSQDQSEDILQETLIAALDGLKNFDRGCSFSAWIFGIARNKANEFHRKITRITELHSKIPDPGIETTNPSHSLEQAEQSELFWNEARQCLSEDQFTCMWLRYQEDLGVTEISEALGKSAANIKIILFRARKTLLHSRAIVEQAGDYNQA